MADSATQQLIHQLSERIVKAQNPIRVLNAIQWDDSIQHDFFKKDCKKLPVVDEQYYARNALGFDPHKKLQEFYDIEYEVNRKLGKYNAISLLMQQRCQEYRDVVHLLMARGTSEFSEISKSLYGSSGDAFYAGAPTLQDLCDTVVQVLKGVECTQDHPHKKKYTAAEAASLLEMRLKKYFKNGPAVSVAVSDKLVADAAAGADTIKLRSGLRFSARNIRVYEVHEGWVHLGTTFNGKMQPICTFLSKGPPSTVIIQEGLAMLTEVLTFSSYPSRVRRLINRIIAIDKAENGANFIDIFNFFREQGIEEVESYENAVRIFRGSTPTLGPFTKDLSYTKGFVLIINYIRLAAQSGRLNYIPLLFSGKVNLNDIHLLFELQEEGFLKPPKYIPRLFKDTAALAAWSGFSLFFNQLDIKKLAADYQHIL